MSADRLCRTLIEIIRIPSTSGHEELVRHYLVQRLHSLGLPTQVDASGNLIATLEGTGRPLLLNAHMDRVPPGLGHEPILRDGILYSDGTTNLGADDAAGIALILEILQRIVEQQLPHPPLVIIFTVQEEAGLCGANSFDSSVWSVTDGIVFDNAFEAGVVVSAGAAYDAFDITISGRTGHPGKDLSQTVHAITIFHDAHYPHGSLANDQTRINIGRIVGGSTRNAIPDMVRIEGELRSFEPEESRQQYRLMIQQGFEQAAQRSGGRADITFTTHSTGYALSMDEPLLNTYRQALAQNGKVLEMRPTFIGSDTSGFRPKIRAFTISTGVVNEHSIDEYVPIAPLDELVKDTLSLLSLWREQ